MQKNFLIKFVPNDTISTTCIQIHENWFELIIMYTRVHLSTKIDAINGHRQS